MKTFLRLLVLFAIALLFFVGGFWFGNRGKTGPSEQETTVSLDAPAIPSEKDLKSKLPGAEVKKEDDESPASAVKAAEENPDAKPGLPELDPGKEGKKMTSAIKSPAGMDMPQETAPADAAPKEESASPSEPLKEKESSPPAPDANQKDSAPPSAEKAEGAPAEADPGALSFAQGISYSIQAGAFLEKQLAQERVEELKAKEYPAFLVSAWDDKRQLWHTVRVGHYTDLAEARKAAFIFGRKERIAAYVQGIGTLRFDELPFEEDAPIPDGVTPAKPAQTANQDKSAPGEKEAWDGS